MLVKQPKDICRASAQFGEKNDCTVRALAVLCKAPYEQAHRLLQRAGRCNRRGFNFSAFLGHQAHLLGHKFTEIDHQGATVNRWMRQHPRGRFAVLIRGHATTIIDGKIVDNHANPKSRIRKVYHVTPDNQTSTSEVAASPIRVNRLEPNDRVQINEHCGTKYLRGLKARVVQVNDNKCLVEFDAGQHLGRFSKYCNCVAYMLTKI